jgi:ABC-2 type transport system permease protein
MIRVWLRFVKISLLARLVYRADLLLSVLSSSLFLLVYLSVWKALYRNPGADEEFVPYSAMALYVAGGTVLRSWLSSDPEFFIRKIRSGDIANDLMKPYPLPLALLAQNVGTGLWRVMTGGIPVLLVALLLMDVPLPKGSDVLWFLASALLAGALYFCYTLMISLTAFWTLEMQGFHDLQWAVMAFASGTVVPLWFMPSVLASVLRALPFQQMGFVPLTFWSGQAGDAALKLLLGQFFWLLPMALLAALVWRAAQRRVVIQGG